MITEKQDLKPLFGFFAAMAAFWALLGFGLMQFGYHGLFTQWASLPGHSLKYFSNFFFTHLGDGLILPAILLLFMRKKDPALAVSAILAILLTGLLAQILKRGFFGDWGRPPLVFEGQWDALGIYPPDPPKHHSFPSGHSTSMAAGGLFFAVYLVRQYRTAGILVGVFTSFLCYTRAIIGVHFQGDILFGGMIGALGSLPVLLLIYPRLNGFCHGFKETTRRRFATGVLILAPIAILLQFIQLTNFDFFIRETLLVDWDTFFLVNSNHTSILDTLMIWVSDKFFWVPMYLLALFGIWKMYQWKGLIAGTVIAVLMIVLADQGSGVMKRNFERPRPCHDERFENAPIHSPSGKCGSKYGFVSSHAANFFALATFLTFLFRKRNPFLPFLFFFCAALVAYSRVYLGVHWPLDVTAGGLYGVACGLVAILAWQKTGKYIHYLS